MFNNKFLQITYQNDPEDKSKKTQAFEKVELIDIVNGNERVFEFDCRFKNNKPVHTFPIVNKLPVQIPEG